MPGISDIRKRDAGFGPGELPDHWIAQCDRRALLAEIDRLTYVPERRVDHLGTIWQGSEWCGYIDTRGRDLVRTILFCCGHNPLASNK